MDAVGRDRQHAPGAGGGVVDFAHDPRRREAFVAVDEQFKPQVVYAATAYAKGGKPEASMIDIEGTEQVIPIVGEECAKEPQASFWQKLKGAMARVRTEARGEMHKVEKKM